MPDKIMMLPSEPLPISIADYPSIKAKSITDKVDYVKIALDENEIPHLEIKQFDSMTGQTKEPKKYPLNIEEMEKQIIILQGRIDGLKAIIKDAKAILI